MEQAMSKHRILVWIDVDEEYADIDPEITADDYMEGSKSGGWEVVTERMFTESEVKAMLNELRDAAGHDAIDSAMKEVGIDPA